MYPLLLNIIIHMSVLRIINSLDVYHEALLNPSVFVRLYPRAVISNNKIKLSVISFILLSFSRRGLILKRQKVEHETHLNEFSMVGRNWGKRFWCHNHIKSHYEARLIPTLLSFFHNNFFYGRWLQTLKSAWKF